MFPTRYLAAALAGVCLAAAPAFAAKKSSTKTSSTTTTVAPATTTTAAPAPSAPVAPTTTTTTTTTTVAPTTTEVAAATPALTSPSVEWIKAAPATTIELNPFAATSFWRELLPATQPVDPNSTALVSDLVRQVNLYGPWINTTQYTAPVYTVGADQPKVPVILDAWTPSLKEAFAAGVPLPSNAVGSMGTDGSAVVHQPSTDSYWEFWRLRKDVDGWHARWGGVIDNASQSSGVFAPGFGTAASGLALEGGMIRPGEFKSWLISHVMRMSVPEVTAGVIRAPANRTDGKAVGGIPMGTRFQLDPTLNVSRMGLPLPTQIIAYAAQRYGFIVGDSSGAVSLYGEDPLTMTTNPWPQLFGNLNASQVMRAFPWSKLRALPPRQP